MTTCMLSMYRSKRLSDINFNTLKATYFADLFGNPMLLSEFLQGGCGMIVEIRNVHDRCLYPFCTVVTDCLKLEYL